jgi:caffeoyl-CoA O-methyltransferase
MFYESYIKLTEYIEKHTSPESEILARLNRETHVKILQSRMISGHVQGKLLEFLSLMIAPKYILEIGTFTGYSSICLASGLQKDGEIHTIECNDEIVHFAEKYFREAGISQQAVIHTGDALNIIPGLDRMFDLIFIDGEKTEYPEYYELCMDKLSPGGYILIDNVLWNGKVLDTPEPTDDDTSSIQQLNDKIQADRRVENIILPLRDGLMLVRKVV